MVDGALEQVLVDGLCQLTAVAQTNAPSRSGTYRRTIQWGRNRAGNFWFGSKDRKASWLEFGTPAHEIWPRFKKSLRWQESLGLGAQLAGVRGRVGVQHVARTNFVRSSGKRSLSWYTSKSSKTQNDVFAKHVNHPGTAAQPHLEPAIAEWTPTMPAKIADALVEAVKNG